MHRLAFWQSGSACPAGTDIGHGAPDLFHSRSRGRVRSKNAVAGIRHPAEELGPVDRIITGIQRDNCAHIVGLKLPIAGIYARSHRRADALDCADRRRIGTRRRRQPAQDHRPRRGRACLAVKMVKNVMAGLMPDDEGQFIGILRRSN